MVVPPKHPEMIIFSRKTHRLLGTSILGNPHISLPLPFLGFLQSSKDFFAPAFFEPITMPIKEARLFSLTMPRKPWVEGIPKDTTAGNKKEFQVSGLNSFKIKAVVLKVLKTSTLRLWRHRSFFFIYSASEDMSMVQGNQTTHFIVIGSFK